MIYICCTKYAREGSICMLTVRDDELDMGDNVAALSEVAEGRTSREGLRNHVDCSAVNLLRVSGKG